MIGSERRSEGRHATDARCKRALTSHEYSAFHGIVESCEYGRYFESSLCVVGVRGEATELRDRAQGDTRRVVPTLQGPSAESF